MRYRFDLSGEARRQLARLPRDAQERVGRALDEMGATDDSQWSNVKALQGAAWKGRFRKKIGPYRMIFIKFPVRGVAEVSAILIRSKDTYR
jgi:mRNA-degrading endonuclease RelE of RelBE toxin-antitoxin system